MAKVSSPSGYLAPSSLAAVPLVCAAFDALLTCVQFESVTPSQITAPPPPICIVLFLLSLPHCFFSFSCLFLCLYVIFPLFFFPMAHPLPPCHSLLFILFGCCRLFFPLICHVRLRRRSSFLYPPLPCALPPSVSRPHHSCCRVHLRTKSSAPLLHIHTVRRLNQSVGCNGARGQMENSDGETKAYWGEIVKRQSRLRSAATWSHKRMLFAA